MANLTATEPPNIKRYYGMLPATLYTSAIMYDRLVRYRQAFQLEKEVASSGLCIVGIER